MSPISEFSICRYVCVVIEFHVCTVHVNVCVYQEYIRSISGVYQEYIRSISGVYQEYIR